jgi:hypothetical protein
MIELRPFTRADFEALDENPATAKWRGRLADRPVDLFEMQKYSYSAWEDGKLLGCGGVVDYGGGRGEAWAMLDKDLKQDFRKTHNVVSRFLEVLPFDRIEAVVETAYEDGHRWVKLLGFECEAPRMRKYLCGVDHSLYARVR